MLHRVVLVVLDWLTAVLSWSLFYYQRKTMIEHVEFNWNETFLFGVVVVPFFWLLLYLMQGLYLDVRRLYRLEIIFKTFQSSLLGVVILFFLILIDDNVSIYKLYYKSLILLFLTHFSLTLLIRYVFVTILVRKVQKNKLGFETLLIGGGEKAASIYKEISSLPKGIGNNFIGFVGEKRRKDIDLNHLGDFDDIEKIVDEYQVEEIVLAIDKEEDVFLTKILSVIERKNVRIKVSADVHDILLGSVKMDNIFGALLYEVNNDPMSTGQQLIKRVIDVCISIVSLILLIPLYLVLALLVKFSSEGPIFFRQERIGKNGKPFYIIKYRTMYVNAEDAGPQLSSEKDPRITKVGRVMRKLRLDEFPQFWNVLVGDMSLVGPRPERQFYIDQIATLEPQFLQLVKVRPGITSWGQVKFGYAENVEQMIQRMKFDLLYLNNRSLALDFKIMLHTILIIFKAKGK